MSSCHWKSLVPFCLWKKRSENALLHNSELSQNHTGKQIMPFKTTVNWWFNEMWCYLVIALFDWKIGIFQQTVVRTYCILKWACQTLSKAFDISSVTARVAPDLLNSLAIQTARRPAVDWEDLKPYWKLERRPHFSGWSTILLFTSFNNHRKNTNRVVVFSSRPFSNIFKYRDHWWNLPTIRKTRLLQTLIEEFS